ncbi:MAG TPA: 50S ribosomal protein L3 [Aggregatilinea sp.]|jgi:large subunit ribosomal protein L3|uniref:50S ribosomal protein L3 n=1 Tax=Aggregatilinea sp. TaxID=2806333 RepID=UPI002B85DD20|nr:50S ribosomal protein L3 [Aggregatilinea sp.]HML22123.1 50S ribosomal protein L3 [Aggregatilinea sp.]
MKGIIGKKVGMTQIFDTDGKVIPVTVIQAGPCYVTQIRTAENDGYTAVQLGFDELPPKRNGSSRLNKPKQGHLKRSGLNLPDLRVLREFRVKTLDVEEGQQLNAAIFERGDRIDVIGTSKGRGFAGTIKRHNFNRGPKTHGQSDRERAPGSIGSTTTPGRVLKGTRMGGRMGGDRVTVQNLEVVEVDADKNLLAVRGSVPGARGGILLIREARKTHR